MPKTIYMGLNTEPVFGFSEKYKNVTENHPLHAEMVRATALHEEIVKTLEEEGECRLSWECTGRTRHEMHARQWEEAMPEYKFTIDYQSYGCKVEKRAE